jgi:ATP-binding cassette, subfamily B, bacterial
VAARRDQSLRKALPGFGRVLARLRPYMRRVRGLIAQSLVLMVVGVLLRLVEPWPLKFIFDRVIGAANGARDRFSFIPAFESTRVETLLVWSAGVAVAVVCLRALAEYVTEVGFARIGNRVLTDVRNDVFRHVQGLDLKFHTSARGGDLLIRMVNDVNLLRDAASTAILPLVANVLVFVGMWGVMFWLHWKLALAGLATLPLLWLRTVRLSTRIREAARKQRQRQGDLAAVASEAVGAIKVVQAFSLQRVFGGAFDARSEQTQRQDVRAARLSAALGRSVDMLLGVATGLVLWYGAALVLRRDLTPGGLLIFLTYLRRAFNPVQDLAKYTGRIAKATAAGERVLELLDRPPLVADVPGATPAPAFRGHVRLEDVGFGYDAARPVLAGVDLEALPGQTVALVGPSGIGKSTLANLLLRLYDPDAGRVVIDGADIRGYALASVRGQMSIVLQDGVLFGGTVRENIAHGKPGCTEAEIVAAARLANVHEFVAGLPDGYETLIGERGATLSGGQRQRIAIARAAVRGAPILILDEPTNGLDEENERAVIDALARLSAGRTTFLITHDLRLAARADRIAYLEDAGIRETGTHAELMRLGGRYAAVYTLQAAVGRDATGADAQGREEAPSHALAS